MSAMAEIHAYLNARQAAGERAAEYAERYDWMPADWETAENYGTLYLGALHMPVYDGHRADETAAALLADWDDYLTNRSV